jgi:pyruvate-ferredoxin/flavodoxin oxidoreductase
MKPLEGQLPQQEVFDYLVEKVSEKPELHEAFKNTSVKGSQFLQPLLEFSGACSGCGETPYAKLVTQLYGDRMYIANATGCSSIWGGSAPSTPYTVNKQGKGPAWANSLFEDNAEFGLGYVMAVEQRRRKMADTAKVFADAKIDGASPTYLTDLVKASKEWLEVMFEGDASKAASEKLLAAAKTAVKECNSSGCEWEPHCKYIIQNSDMLIKKSIWVFGGDGWAYDIGFGGLDHVIASGQDINILVFDTEVYSNTGGQASKSSQIGQVAQFAAAGKTQGKKDLAQIAMSYGTVYVAQVAMGADQAQTIKAITEAESFKGPSLVIGYAPCINHGVKGGLANAMAETKNAVESGYWHTFRFDPRLKAEGKNPFQLDSKPPTKAYKDFIETETRYKSLMIKFPERAEDLFEKADKAAQTKYQVLANYAKLHE